MTTLTRTIAWALYSPAAVLGRVLALATLAGLATVVSAQTSVHEQILGTYRLAKYSAHGEEPIGRISYDSAGRMWAMILPPNRAPIERDSPPEAYRDTMRGVVSYYGTYTIDEASQRVIHHVQAASNPAWIGTDFIRWYKFEGPNQNLVISLRETFDSPLLWERLEEGRPAAAKAPDKAAR